VKAALEGLTTIDSVVVAFAVGNYFCNAGATSAVTVSRAARDELLRLLFVHSL
jgi:hypothetical protein